MQTCVFGFICRTDIRAETEADNSGFVSGRPCLRWARIPTVGHGPARQTRGTRLFRDDLGNRRRDPKLVSVRPSQYVF